jgi:hypothetical protein
MIPARPPCSWAVEPHKQVEAWKARKCIERKSPKAKTLRGKTTERRGASEGAPARTAEFRRRLVFFLSGLSV